MLRLKNVHVAVLLGLLASTAGAQDEAQPAAGDVERIEVRLVNLEILATDHEGRPVTGLTAEDFEIVDDGDPVEIIHFASPPGLSADRREDAPEPAAAPASSAPAEPPLLVFYFDALHLTRDQRRPVLDALERFLWEQRVPAERVMVLNQTQDVQMLAPFGSSVERLVQALEELAPTTTSDSANEADRSRMIRAVFSGENSRETAGRQRSRGAAVSSSAEICTRLEGTWRQIQTFAAEASSRGAKTLDHLRTYTDLLGGLPGAKVLVYVGGGLEIEPAADVARFVGRQCPTLHGLLRQMTRATSLDRGFKSLVLEASSRRITFYTLEAPPARQASQGVGETGGFKSAAEIQLLRSGNPQAGLIFLAEETGGRAVLEQSRFDRPLTMLAEDLGAFYSLAYTPPAEPDGREHEVKVKVRDPRKLQLRYRRSYRNVAVGKTPADHLLSALRFGWADNPLGVKIGYGALRSHPENAATFLVPVRFTLSLDRLRRLTEEEGSRARLRLILASRDHSGRVLGPLSQYYDIALPSTAEDLGDQTFEFTTEMVPGRQDLALGFVDELSGEASFLIENLELPVR